jgi:membrane protease subunit HflC
MRTRWIALSVVGVIAVILLISSMFVVKEGEYKIVLKFGEVSRVHDAPGLKFRIPFVETVTTLPKYQMVYESAPAEILTLDQKPIVVDNYTVWRIDNPRSFLRTVRDVAIGEQRIDNAIYNVVRRKLSELEYGSIISENTARGDLNVQITQEVAGLMEESGYGIKIVDVRIRRTDLPEANKESVYNRMISDRQSIAAKYLSEGDEESRKIMSSADRQAKVLVAQAEAEAKRIIADGEQEAARIYNEAYGKDPEFYQFYRTLQSYMTTLQGEPVIMMPIDSPYARILLGQE